MTREFILYGSVSGYLLDRELVSSVSATHVEGLDKLDLSALREGMSALYDNNAINIDGVSRTELSISGSPQSPDIRVLVYEPDEAPSEARGAILYLHGGGYILGAPEQADQIVGDVIRRTGCVVVAPAYRLAPETPFPGAIEDCYATLKWLHSAAGDLQIDCDHILISGMSAGGGLAAALALLARDRGEISIAGQILMYSMLDDRTGSTNTSSPYSGEFVWTPAYNRYAWQAMLGHSPGLDNVSPYASAARAIDLKGLPPTYISIGALDLFLAENLEYARRLIASGVPTELHVYPGAHHGFDVECSAAVAKSSKRNVLSAIGRILNKHSAARKSKNNTPVL